MFSFPPPPLPLSLSPSALHSGQRLLDDLPTIPVGGANAKSKNNYASIDCGAKVIKHNKEAKVYMYMYLFVAAAICGEL